jgi:bidirectional [NiFe] hydrogenase diaphorase subunit
MSAKTLIIDGKHISANEGSTVLQAARDNAINIPTLCHLDGVDDIGDIGACRLCIVEVKGTAKLLAACTTKVAEGMEITTQSERIAKYRRMALELLFAERNHVCSTCVVNGHCGLQTLAAELGMDHVRYEYQFPKWGVDVTHRLFGLDHNRCILCTRCVRACWEIEGAGTKNVAGRGAQARIVTDLSQPWGTSTTCTECGKCVMSCPTGALFKKGATAAESERDREKLVYIVNAREKKQWNV